MPTRADPERYRDAAPTVAKGREENQQTRLPVEQEIAGAAPVVSANFPSGSRESAHPPGLGPGETRGSTAEPDHFRFLDNVKAACPAVNRKVVVRVHVEEPFHSP